MGAPPQLEETPANIGESKYRGVHRICAGGCQRRLTPHWRSEYCPSCLRKLQRPLPDEEIQVAVKAAALDASMSARPDITARLPKLADWLKEKNGREIRIRNEGPLGARITLEEKSDCRRFRREMSLSIESLDDVALIDFAFNQLLHLPAHIITEANA